ncbi:MAG: methyltransferase domain-containing protein [Actinomycetota bacterium]|nr:methyltransferase domain-containing protein [Actinomycetota bacterium]
MPIDNTAAWNRISADEPGGVLPAVDSVQYGPDIDGEAELRLLGSPTGKRVLEIGCGGGQNLVAMAKQGAHAIGLDFAPPQLTAVKRLAESEGVRVELHQGPLSELPFLRADSVDIAFSAYALGFVEDLNRVFRQVHRVLKEGAPFAFSMPHPTYDLIDDDAEEPLLIRRSYFDPTPVEYSWDGQRLADHHRTFAEVFAGMCRAKFRVDTILEPEPRGDGPRSRHWRDTFRMVPRTLIVRGRKEGS